MDKSVLDTVLSLHVVVFGENAGLPGTAIVGVPEVMRIVHGPYYGS